jgi:hypothetical protein
MSSSVGPCPDCPYVSHAWKPTPGPQPSIATSARSAAGSADDRPDHHEPSVHQDIGGEIRAELRPLLETMQGPLSKLVPDAIGVTSEESLPTLCFPTRTVCTQAYRFVSLTCGNLVYVRKRKAQRMPKKHVLDRHLQRSIVGETDRDIEENYAPEGPLGARGMTASNRPARSSAWAS